MAIGSLAGAGTLGLLIPPSIIIMIGSTGVAANVPTARPFIAGVLPGIMPGREPVLRLHHFLGFAQP